MAKTHKNKEKKHYRGYIIGKHAFFHNLLVDIRRNKVLYLFLIVILAYFAIFHYAPMVGLVMAFEKYVPVKGFFGSKWIGLQNFRNFFTGPYVGRLIKNTVIIGLLDLLVNFPAPIIFALLLNEIRLKFFKRSVQTISYMPYFISSVVAMGLVISFTKAGGFISDAVARYTGGVSENLLNSSTSLSFSISDTGMTVEFDDLGMSKLSLMRVSHTDAILSLARSAVSVRVTNTCTPLGRILAFS